MLPSGAAELGLNFARITLGAYLDHGVLVKGIKDIKTCIRKCAQAGGGVATFTNGNAMAGMDILASPQICFGIDYDFSTHKCYFHTRAGVFTADTFAAPAQIASIPGGIRCFHDDADPFETQPRTPINLGSRANNVNVVICKCRKKNLLC